MKLKTDENIGTGGIELVRAAGHDVIDEYAAAYPDEELGHVDICDMGFWTKDGQYEPPVLDFRAQVAQDRAPA